MKPQKETLFTRFADWVSEAIGTPTNIILWVVLVAVWILLFALHILNSSSSILPDWFTSNAFNFPLNTVTTLVELYVGFLCAAAMNRVEKRNASLHERMMELVEKEEMDIETLIKK